MHHYYRDYGWEEGRPIGIGKITREASLCYRLVSDPYQKWLSIEMYREGQFATLIYDSRLLDFRRLTAQAQAAWRKERIDSRESWIYNEDDRLILKERYSEMACAIYSPHSLLLCRYALLKDEARVVLYDSHHHLVMTQQYRVFADGEFIDLQEENWSLTTEKSLPSPHVFST